MNIRITAILLIGLLALSTAESSAQIVNGDFETGDLTGWTSSAYDASDDPLDPADYISVEIDDGNHVVAIRTGEFAAGLSFASLEQTFEVTGEDPYLQIDFSLPELAPDPTGDDASEFWDALFVGIDDGVDFFDLMLLDQVGPLADPFESAPGGVILGPPSDPSFDFGMSADLSALAGQPVILFLDVFGEDDGFQTVFDSDNARMTVPEPAGFALVVFAGIILLASRRHH